MKHTLVRSILTPAVALALPCLAFAQAGSSSTKPSSTPSSHDRTMSSPGYSASDASGGHLQRITSDQLDNQLTAKTLIGMDVNGSDGKKVGSVVDVVLSSSLSMGKTDMRGGSTSNTSASANRGSTSNTSASAAKGSTGSTSNTTASAARGTTGSTSNTSPSTSRDSNYSETGTTGARSSGSLAADGRSAMGSMHGMQQPAVIVSTGGLMGIGNDLIRVPMSKINFDSDKKEIRLNVTEDEWKALREGKQAGSVSSTR